MKKLILLLVLIVVIVVIPLIWYEGQIEAWPEVTGHVTRADGVLMRKHIAWEYTVSSKNFAGYTDFDIFGFPPPKVGDEIKLKHSPSDPANSIAPKLDEAKGKFYVYFFGFFLLIIVPVTMFLRRTKVVS